MYGINKKQIIMMLVLAGAIIFGAGYKLSQVTKEPVVNPVLSENRAGGDFDKPKPAPPKKITVYVCGAVKKPGVYNFDEGARVIEGIQRAEAFNDAALTSINLAEVMSDGQQIYVPRTGEDGVLTTGVSGSASPPAKQGGMIQKSTMGTGKININTAGKDAFDQLPGVGPATAEKIIEYRAAHGKFKSVSELTNVPGIGEKKLAKFRDKIRV